MVPMSEDNFELPENDDVDGVEVSEEEFEEMDDEEKIKHLKEKLETAEELAKSFEETQVDLQNKLLEKDKEIVAVQKSLLEVQNALAAQATLNADLSDKFAAIGATKLPSMDHNELSAAVARDLPAIRAIILKIKGAESPLLVTIDEMLAHLASLG